MWLQPVSPSQLLMEPLAVLCSAFKKHLQSLWISKSLEILNAFGCHTQNLEFKGDFLYVLQDYLGTSIWIRSSCSMQIKNLQVSAVLLVLQVLLSLCCVRIIWPFLSCQLNVTQCLQLLYESWVLDICAIGTYREVKWAVFSHFLFFSVDLADPSGVSLSWKTQSLRQAKGKKMRILLMTFQRCKIL